jgi:hypothetical protein
MITHKMEIYSEFCIVLEVIKATAENIESEER